MIKKKKYTVKIDNDDHPYSISDLMECQAEYFTDSKKLCRSFSFMTYSEDIPENYSQKFPLYMYEHSGVMFTLSKPSCPFDSSFVGYAMCDDSINEEYIKSELEEINNILEGNLYQYKITKQKMVIIDDIEYLSEPDDDYDSCYGFTNKKYCIDSAKEAVNNLIKDSNVEVIIEYEITKY